eukprot:CAMPEP_0119408976 /NCGR_PEP_ID=MMETSP1335-20130426/2370_1 /TAXON_ID=259385 /ORGANISM="Chrysoculter rhomboideus, Strain RCC1486" /LENGTH=113 /DNA_ID=CAMNT_0007433277 /DNA_START=26 /DNA_END=367 /DNA_ORIENTATION=+
MSELKQLKVKAGVVRRVLKDLDYTKKETAAQAAKVEKMKAEQADPYDIKKQEEVLAECASHRPLDEERLENAIDDLTRLVSECRESPDFDDLKETEEFKAAATLLEESAAASN